MEKFKPVYKNGANRYWLNGNHIQILKYFIFNHVNRNVDNLMSEIMSYTSMNRELKSDKVNRSVLFFVPGILFFLGVNVKKREDSKIQTKIYYNLVTFRLNPRILDSLLLHYEFT